MEGKDSHVIQRSRLRVGLFLGARYLQPPPSRSADLPPSFNNISSPDQDDPIHREIVVSAPHAVVTHMRRNLQHRHAMLYFYFSIFQVIEASLQSKSISSCLSQSNPLLGRVVGTVLLQSGPRHEPRRAWPTATALVSGCTARNAAKPLSAELRREAAALV